MFELRCHRCGLLLAKIKKFQGNLLEIEYKCPSCGTKQKTKVERK
ncbi:MAG: hypothetical protein DRN95_04670 [Candidatus Hydrothermarchaeota archaeon]|nr:MAG: hypothetical protein DRN95_04670 [Candidatus Hydrothermarchaeota archaeon]